MIHKYGNGPMGQRNFQWNVGGGGGKGKGTEPYLPQEFPPLYSTILVKQAVLNQDT